MPQAVETEKCTEQGCNNLKLASLNDRARCRAHFICYCYSQIDQCELRVSRKEHWNPAVSDQAYESLSEIADSAAAIGLGPSDLNDIERAQIVHIITHVEILVGHFRRFPRKKMQIPITVRVKATETQEAATTIDISQKGASFTHKHLLNRGDLVLLWRQGGHEKQARVIWTRISQDKYVSGVELIDCSNFWEPQISE